MPEGIWRRLPVDRCPSEQSGVDATKEKERQGGRAGGEIRRLLRRGAAMSERILRMMILMSLASCAVAARASGTEGIAGNSKPNIVFILFDDLGYGEPPSFRAASDFK